LLGEVEGTGENCLDGRNVGTCVLLSAQAGCKLGAAEVGTLGTAEGPDVSEAGIVVDACAAGELLGTLEGPDDCGMGTIDDASAPGELVCVAVTCMRRRQFLEAMQQRMCAKFRCRSCTDLITVGFGVGSPVDGDGDGGIEATRLAVGV
jgi:hypothetical protein